MGWNTSSGITAFSPASLLNALTVNKHYTAPTEICFFMKWSAQVWHALTMDLMDFPYTHHAFIHERNEPRFCLPSRRWLLFTDPSGWKAELASTNHNRNLTPNPKLTHSNLGFVLYNVRPCSASLHQSVTKGLVTSGRALRVRAGDWGRSQTQSSQHRSSVHPQTCTETFPLAPCCGNSDASGGACRLMMMMITMMIMTGWFFLRGFVHEGNVRIPYVRPHRIH